jgi:predicted PhzF superfamily epimerase YddE/YHI9
MQIYIADAFTTAPFTGNPAGVCFPGRALPEASMLQIAMELGLSETAFVLPTAREDTWSIRYFSPKQEIPLCGHATMASAKVVFSTTALERIHSNYGHFWPWSGTDEDPVTGGVRTFLAKYWSARLHKTHVRAFQSSARTGSMSLELLGGTVLLCSDAVIVLEWTLAASLQQ